MITQAICWTLLHSLWQGALAALIAGGIILGTRRVKAAVRYNLLVADLGLFLAATAVSFCLLLGPGGSRASVAVVTNGGSEHETFLRLLPEADAGMAAGGSVMQPVVSYLNIHASVIVLIWLVCLGGQLMRLTSGLYRIHRIRRSGELPIADEWQEKLSMLARQMGIKKPVALLQSASVMMPAVAGILRPVVLVPLGMLAQLPPKQVETIFLHELAHIRRGDYWVNLVIHLSEAIFFFNPGLRWVAALLREEREACCDDAVLATTGDSTVYFDALVGFMQLTLGRKELAMPLSKGKGELLWRVRRMLTKENKKLHIMEKTVLSFGLMAMVAIGLISMRGQEPQEPAPAKVKAPVHAVTTMPVIAVKDTIPATASAHKHVKLNMSMSIRDDGDNRLVRVTATDEDGNTYTFKEVNDEVKEFSVNGKAIAKEDYSKYDDIMDQIEERADTPPVAPIAPIPPVEPVAPVMATEPMTPVAPIEPLPPMKPVAAIAPMEPMPPVAPVAPIAPLNPNFNYWIRQIIRDLTKDGIVTSKDPLSFTLDNDGLIVNKVKQTDEVFKRYKDKYLDKPKSHFIYDHHGGFTHSDIDTDKKTPEEI